MSNNTPIPVFDIGQVLVRWEPVRVFQKYWPDLSEARRVMDEIGFNEWHGQQDAGRPVAEAVAEASARLPPHRQVISGFYEHWLDAVPGEVTGTRAIFEGLAAKAPVFGISNFSRELFDRTVPVYPFLGQFTGLVLSGDERLIKPDPRIYHVLFQRYGLDPADCIFIDDSPANVAGAQREGMDAILFTDAPSLSDALRARGLSW